MAMTGRGVATVVVPTRDRPVALAACLAALDAQTAEVEVVVVDDGSLAADHVAEVVARSPRARLLRAEGRGPATARNRGAAASRTGVVCFTDDDCRPEPTWAERMAARIADGAAAVVGPTRNGWEGDAVAAAAQTVTNHLVEASLSADGTTVGFGPTSNLAVTADLHDLLPFDEDYPLAAGEDRDWCARVAAAGHRIAWAPEAVVAHHPHLDLRGFWRQQSRYGRGAARLHGGGGRQPASFYVDLVRKGVAQGPRTGALVLLSQLATADGLVREGLALRTRR